MFFAIIIIAFPAASCSKEIYLVPYTPGSNISADSEVTQGVLDVKTSPALTANIYCNGLPMDNGSVSVRMSPGTYTISFEPVDGYITPASVDVIIAAGVTTSLVGTYVPGVNAVPAGNQGSLRVETSPALPTTIYLNGFPRDDWGINWVKLQPATYNLYFSEVPGHKTPASVTVNYYPGTTGNIQPIGSPIIIYPNTVTEVIAYFQ